MDYRLSEELLQAAVAVLNTLPAGQVRGLLNAIEETCRAQDAERREAELAAIRRAAVEAAAR